jgi:hypothetical protein
MGLKSVSFVEDTAEPTEVNGDPEKTARETFRTFE